MLSNFSCFFAVLTLVVGGEYCGRVGSWRCGTLLSRLWNELLDLSRLWNGLPDLLSRLWNGLLDLLSRLWNGLLDLLSRLWNGLLDWLCFICFTLSLTKEINSVVFHKQLKMKVFWNSIVMLKTEKAVYLYFNCLLVIIESCHHWYSYCRCILL